MDLSQQQLENLVKDRLKSGPCTVEELSQFLYAKQIPFSRRTAKRFAWSLVERGEAQFNNSWQLELKVENA